MRERELRKRCRDMLRQLDIQPPLDVAELCGRVGARRGRPINLVAHPIPVPGPFGVWIATENTDYILYQQQTSKSHQDHIILHELGHLLAGHHSDEEDDELLGELYPDVAPEALRARYPDLAPDAVRRALRRSSYDTEQEREAETVATIILEWASVLDRVAPRASQQKTSQQKTSQQKTSQQRTAQQKTAQRMENALADRIGWL